MVEVSFIIIEYHSISEVLRCVDSIKKLALPFKFEVVVSSNSEYSRDFQDNLRSMWNMIHWVFNIKNGGFAYAMNTGMAEASGNIIAIMNPDVQVVYGFEGMIHYLCGHDHVGAIAPQIVNNDCIVQDSARSYITVISFFLRHIRRCFFLNRLYEKKNIVLKIQTVDWVIGAFIMVKREVYEKTLGLDDRYFLYCEDMDWCTRIHQYGYDIIYYPLAQIKYEGTRSARKSIKYSLIFLKSLFRYWGKFGFLKIRLI